MNEAPTPVTEQLRLLAAAEPGLLDALAGASSIDAALQMLAEASARTALPIDLAAAREAMTQALAGGATPLSDEALATVAGGVLNGSVIWSSIMTLGLSCALASIVEAAKQRDCGAFFGR